MKNKWFIGLYVLLIFLFVFEACDSRTDDDEYGNTDPKSVKITGIPHSSKYTVLLYENDGTFLARGVDRIDVEINNTLSVPLKIFDGGWDTASNWTGAGAYVFSVYDEDNGIEYYYTNGSLLPKNEETVLKNLPKFKFTDTVSIIDFSKFKSYNY